MHHLLRKQRSIASQQEIFAEYPVPKAVATMVIPTIISQIITVI